MRCSFTFVAEVASVLLTPEKSAMSVTVTMVMVRYSRSARVIGTDCRFGCSSDKWCGVPVGRSPLSFTHSEPMCTAHWFDSPADLCASLLSQTKHNVSVQRVQQSARFTSFFVAYNEDDNM